ncbi:PREDICTED: polyadenylate-binding protein-interacting protein 7 [Nelumbo nucifera]|uniref:Polyadenylate-binding protein-interacting protein 7 n=1 Tax=Nelumbo nucifera TaxID=4432 RepID=A0A1U8BC90_NELNU|nr:PREDICTED: polyadenylate-binding protein-interacting protein 7 [Nelumbo nucifera]
MMMSLSSKRITTNNARLNTPSKTTTLNPNATEFIPYALRSPSGTTGFTDASARLDGSATSGKAVLDRSESSASNNSDDEVHQYWRHQLPDDITPDFKFTEEDDLQGPGSFSLTGLSITDEDDTSSFSASTGSSQMLNKIQELSSCGIDGKNTVKNMRYLVPSYGEDQSTAFTNLPAYPWEKQFINGDQHIRNGNGEFPYSGHSSVGFLNHALSNHMVLSDSDLNPVEFLALQFPGFAAESLAEVYYANGCDLNLTIEMLTQLELQVDSGLNQNLSSKTSSAPNLSALDFPALAVSTCQNGPSKYSANAIEETTNPYQSSDKDNILLFKSSYSTSSRGATDFASAVRKLASQDSGEWKYEKNGSMHTNVGSSKSSLILSSSYSGGHGKSTYGDRLQNHGSARAAPVWLETGEAVANMYSELRGEARDHARLRNACFEQARQAYLIGNKALAKELSAKGQLHNAHMKAAHEKAQEAIYRQRNPVSPEFQGYRRGQEQMIDLHGLHVSESIRVLKQELSILRAAARSNEQRLQVYICVGTGHHTKGSRTPARLPVAVERYLLEEEGLDYTEPQPGLLRVVI